MGIFRKLLGKDMTTDVCDLLTLQHKQVDELIEKIEKGEGDRAALFTELADNLGAHATVEEKVFYPAIMAKNIEDMLHEAVEEHLAIKRLLADMITKQLDKDEFTAKLKVLKEQVQHHAHKEEEDELFPKVRDAMTADERAALGNELLVMFEDLMETHPYRTIPSETEEAATLPTPRA